MAYTVHYHGHQVACDTAEEVRALLSPNGTNGAKPRPATPPPSPANPGVPSINTAELLAKLQPEQRNAIRQISQHGTISRDDLSKLLDITDTHRLSGIMIGIQKSAAKSGTTTPIETLYERENGNGPRMYRYRIKRDVIDAVKEGLLRG